jgi:hypothetical protein
MTDLSTRKRLGKTSRITINEAYDSKCEAGGLVMTKEQLNDEIEQVTRERNVSQKTKKRCGCYGSF